MRRFQFAVVLLLIMSVLAFPVIVLLAQSAKDDRPVMYGWSTDSCPPCVAAHKVLDNDKTLPFQVVWNPIGVPNPYEVFPAFVWASENKPHLDMNKNWKQRGWPGKEKLVETFSKRLQ